MGVRINTNLQSLRAQFALSKTTSKLNNTLTRLTTGLRINDVSDDVVGMTKSESLRYELTGITQSKINAGNMRSILNVSEGYLSQLTDLAQELRTKAVQAADDTIGGQERNSLNDYFDDLVTEFERLTTSANFNSVNLLDGTFLNEIVQVGPNTSDVITTSIADTRTTAIGQVAIYTAESRTVTSTQATASASFAGPAVNIDINGETLQVGDFIDDGVSTVESTESAISYVAAINAISGASGVQAQTLSNVFNIDYSAGAALEPNQDLIINGVTITSGLNVSNSDDADATLLVSLINDASTQTGVDAILDTDTDTIRLEASDGRNINIQVSARGTISGDFNVFGITGGINNTQVTQRGNFRLVGNSAYDIDNAQNEFTAGINQAVAVDANFSLDDADLSTQSNAETAIFILDNVISQLITRRADVGANMDEVDNAEQALLSIEQNLTQSRSVIQDADIAVETAMLTKMQILQQAGVTVLAQANASPQALLNLLRG